MTKIINKFVGVDVETTGLDPRKHAIIQLGISFGIGRTFWMDHNPPRCEIDPGALAVNHFTIDRIRNGFSTSYVTGAALDFIKNQVATMELMPEERHVEMIELRLIPVGFNVDKFDRGFLEAWLPDVANQFHYQAVELNSIIFALGGGEQSGRVKKGLKAEGLAKLGLLETDLHDAGVDAELALVIFDVIRTRVVSVNTARPALTNYATLTTGYKVAQQPWRSYPSEAFSGYASVWLENFEEIIGLGAPGKDHDCDDMNCVPYAGSFGHVVYREVKGGN